MGHCHRLGVCRRFVGDISWWLTARRTLLYSSTFWIVIFLGEFSRFYRHEIFGRRHSCFSHQLFARLTFIRCWMLIWLWNDSVGCCDGLRLACFSRETRSRTKHRLQLDRHENQPQATASPPSPPPLPAPPLPQYVSPKTINHAPE